MGTPERVPVVVFVQRAVLEYRAAFYEQLREVLADRGIRLELVRSGPRSGYARADEVALTWMVDRPALSLRFRGRELLWQRPGSQARAADLVIVEQAARLPSNVALLLRPGGPAVALWGHGRSFETAARRSRLGEWAKRRLYPAPNWWFAYNQLAAEAVLGLGFPVERLTVVDNSTDTRRLRQRMAEVSPERVAALRRLHDLGEGPIALFLGNLSSRKRLDYLLAASDCLAASVEGFRLVIVGDGEQRAAVRDSAGERDHVRLLGHRSGEALADVLAASSVLLVPAWAGLVVVDSFAAGVPLCASRSMDHPPEISYIEDGVNGLLIDDGGEPGRYAAAVAEVLREAGLYERLVAGCAVAAAHYTVEGMVERFADGIQRALGQDPRGRPLT